MNINIILKTLFIILNTILIIINIDYIPNIIFCIILQSVYRNSITSERLIVYNTKLYHQIS